MSDSEKVKEASAKIAAILKEIKEKYAEAAVIADEAGVDFSFDGPTYGAGGSYYPEGWAESSEYTDEDIGWQASSQSCW